MTQADVTALRQRACSIVTVLGDVLDLLQTAEDMIQVPDADPSLQALQLSQQLDGAADAAERLANDADGFAKAIDQLQLHARIDASQAATPTPTVH